jgi:hypothetical protein
VSLRQEVSQIMLDTDEKIRLVSGGDMASLQLRWSAVPVDDRMAILHLLFMANNRAIYAIIDHLESNT